MTDTTKPATAPSATVEAAWRNYVNACGDFVGAIGKYDATTHLNRLDEAVIRYGHSCAAAEKARADAAEMRVSSLMEAHGLKDAPAKQPAASLVESAEVVDAAVRVHVVPRALACWLHCRDEAQAKAIRARLLGLAGDEGGT